MNGETAAKDRKDGKKVSFRRASPADAEDLFRLNAAFNGSNSTNLSSLLHSLLENRQEEVYVAQGPNGLIGFICVQLFHSMCYRRCYAEITELFVCEGWRRQGVAMGLLAYAEEKFSSRQIAGYQLFTGEENAAAQALYEKMGYRRSAERMYRKRLPDQESIEAEE